ncbi:HypC/HybG/HupF family hydrogenase formation chaperone [Halomonas denitrificans]|uniref:HypC/HybG/HupF family hydrogenase formation chaperone n=1 Tax=Halomonas denitrificans TaxID=370769 RepID=UPI001CD48D88|nr:HypC/HybG/HupF family hydrogenase formation chaperone [Halomonas denitrificans]MCA0973121.1 HypC/HybG/HupF family hydrogenase formation chaperone [Halomonas denitrificans]
MCVGIPMQVVDVSGSLALCCREAGSAAEQVDIALIGDVEIGDWLLVFLGAARRVLDPEEAQLIRSALDAVALVAKGGAMEAGYFADLESEAPRLPPHLEAARRAGRTSG